jgi:hypothetical protein
MCLWIEFFMVSFPLFFSFLVEALFELRALHLQNRHSTT